VAPRSLAGRFLLTLLATAVLPLLVFGWFALRGVRGLVDTQLGSVFLPQLAADHAEKIDSRLQQIFQSVSVVREIGRSALAEPTRRAWFAEQVELVPDLLDNHIDLLLLVDPAGAVVYWQDGERLDRATQGRRESLVPASAADQPWFQRVQREGGAFWLPWMRSPLLHRGLDVRSQNPADHHLGLVIDVPAGDGPPGALFALVRWPEVQQVLDAARDVLSREAGYQRAQVFLVDPAGTVQAHTDRSTYGAVLEPASLRTAVLGAAGGRAEYTGSDGAAWHCGFRRFGEDARCWSLGIAVPAEELFAPREAFARALGVAVLLLVAVLAAWSLGASRAIVRPVRDLLAGTRQVAAGNLEVQVPAGGTAELRELGSAFNTMAVALASGRDRLKAAERQAAWAEMARQVAHEVKNPLTPMRMAAELLLRARRDGDPRADAIAERLASTVMVQTELLDRIASDFRQFAGSPAPYREAVLADELLASVRIATGSLLEGGLELEVAAGAPAAVLSVDRRELLRMFANLVQNAGQAGAKRVRLSSSVVGGTFRCLVEDDGGGIAPSVQARLFEPYFTTRTSGTGLGLAICRRIVESHGGALTLLESASGRTVFQLDLPLATAP